MVSDEAQDAAAGHTITAPELKEMIDAGKEFELIDVREPHEYEIVKIPGAKLIPKDRILSGEALAEMPQDSRWCCTASPASGPPRRWPRCTRPASATPSTSAAACSAWGQQVDPSLPTY